MNERARIALIQVVIAIGPVLLALAASMAVIILTGGPPVAAMQALAAGAFGGTAQTARTLSFLLPLSIVALAWIISFSTRRINIGLEGQIVVGGITAATIGLFVTGLPSWVHISLAMVVGIGAGAMYAGVAAWLWARRGVNEIISTLMLTFIALELENWLVRGPLQEPGVIFPRSKELAATARWPQIVPNSELTWTILLVPLLVAATWFLFHRTTFGVTLMITGANPDAARLSGTPTTFVNVVALVVSGGLAGLVGAALITGGETGRLSGGFSANLGFEGIVVALVARNLPLAVPPAALLFAILRSGSGLIETRVGVSSELILITQGLVIVAVGGVGFLYQRLRSRPVASETLGGQHVTAGPRKVSAR
jgi:simple sugar transport system permease protein